jgi:16S rRNA (adenine1518-N6/adenine1519-N6)-dimethyltransferase
VTAPRKRFGQNFLVDEGIIGRIVRAVAPAAGDHLVEIGPGRGAITRALADSGAELQVVEIDRDLAFELKLAFPGIRLINEDVMKVDFAELAGGTPLRVVGNLPYNISTQLLFKLLGYGDLIQDMHFMLQLEVVDRMIAEPSTRAYGRLSVMTQLLCEAEKLFEVPPECFYPRPKVQSAIVHLAPRPERLDFDQASLEALLIQAFSARRKTVRNALKNLLPADELVALDIDPGLRPENLTLEDFAACSLRLKELKV